MPLCDIQSESRMRENRTSGLTSGDGKRVMANRTEAADRKVRDGHREPTAARPSSTLLKTCARHSNSVPDGALRVLATLATLNGSSRKPGSEKCRQGPRGRRSRPVAKSGVRVHE